MPNPTAGDLHVNAPLSNVSVAYAQRSEDFVADKLFPVIPVQKQSDLYWTFDRKDWLRSEARERAPGTESVGVGYRVSTESYYSTVYAVHNDIDDQTRANADPAHNLDVTATEFVTNQLLRKRDLLFVDKYMKTGVWSKDLDGVAGAPGANQFKRWDVAGSTPVEDLRTQIISMAQTTGYRPNTLVLGPHTWKALADHAELLDRIKYSQKGVVGPQLLAGLLDIDKVLIAWAIKNTANEGGTESNVFMTGDGKDALLMYVNSNPAPKTVSAGYVFAWTGFLGASAYGGRIKTFRMESIESDRVEGEMAFDMKVIASDLGAFFEDAVA